MVPELVQADFTPERVSTELRRLIPDGEARRTMIHDFQEVRQRLAANDSGGSASDRALLAPYSP